MAPDVVSTTRSTDAVLAIYVYVAVAVFDVANFPLSSNLWNESNSVIGCDTLARPNASIEVPDGLLPDTIETFTLPETGSGLVFVIVLALLWNRITF